MEEAYVDVMLGNPERTTATTITITTAEQPKDAKDDHEIQPRKAALCCMGSGRLKFVPVRPVMVLRV